MKYRYLLLLIALLFTATAFGQMPAQPLQEPDWQTFAPMGEEFVTEVPVPLSSGRFPSTVTSRRYQGLINGTWFFVFSEARNAPNWIPRARVFIDTYQPAGVQETFGGFNGLKYAFEDAEGFSHRAIVFSTKKRTYLIQTVSEKPDDQLAARFFDKLTVGNVNMADTAPVTTTVAQTGPDRLQVLGGPTMAPRPAPPKEQGELSPLKIISKPRATYTEAARIYMVTGRVILRITFGGDGAIGTVTPVTRLPFGLTTSAITAGRTIQFQPATRDGKPFDTTKSVEFGFNIY